MIVEYIPIITTFFAIFFLSKIFPHYLAKKSAKYLLWWSIGVFTFGWGTFHESVNALFGWSEINLKLWYISGALLGGFPLAQGTVYLLMKDKTANILSWIVCSLIAIASITILLSPVDIPANHDGRLSGSVFAWQWVRAFSPVINTYSFIFLFGGAIYSARLYFKKGKTHTRFLGNVFIAIGALLPGIGGSMTRFGHVEVLYITELIGLIAIFIGYRMMKYDKELSIHFKQREFATDS